MSDGTDRARDVPEEATTVWSVHRSLFIALLCSVALIAAACTDSEPGAAGDPTTTATADSTDADGDVEPPPDSDEPADDRTGSGSLQTGGFVPEALDWSSCEAFECATLMVPLDYGDPGGEQIEIAVTRSATTGDERIGSVLLNPGGPGGSGIDYLQAAALTLPTSLSSRFDLVSFDPRGVGQSSSVNCDLDLDDAIDLLADGDTQAWNAVLEQEKELFGGCEGLDLAPYVGTNNAARDMDVMREALGDEKLTYIGYSYGTRLGAAYAELFPENVRALVLDAAVLPDSDLTKLDSAQAGGFDLAFNNFAAACDADTDCILQDIGPTLEVFRALEDEIADVGSFSVDGGRRLTAGELRYGVLASLYSVDTWPILAEGLFVAETLGDGTILQFLADSLLDRQADGSYSNSREANRYINCADDPNRTSVEQTRIDSSSAGDESEFFGGIFRAGTGCLIAPDPIDPLAIGPADGAPPILVIGNTGDPATPYAWSVQLAEELSSGVLYTVEAEGHTAYGSFDCVEADVTAYLVDLTVPTTTTCSENATADFFPPTGESDFDLIIGFFDCLIEEGLDIEPITTAAILADPTGEALFVGIDPTDPETGAAILACQSFLTGLS